MELVNFLKGQHNHIKTLFLDAANASGKARHDAWLRLRSYLAVHETAEEQIVHPTARATLKDGERVVRARLDEEHKGKELLAKMEDMQVDSREFGEALSRLQAAVLEHAEAEESMEFNALAAALKDQPKTVDRMLKAVQFAESIAPTRAHPAVGESATANTLAGPFVSMVDRVRDMLAKGSTGTKSPS